MIQAAVCGLRELCRELGSAVYILQYRGVEVGSS
jgi:hypothetical protein